MQPKSVVIVTGVRAAGVVGPYGGLPMAVYHATDIGGYCCLVRVRPEAPAR